MTRSEDQSRKWWDEDNSLSDLHRSECSDFCFSSKYSVIGAGISDRSVSAQPAGGRE
jgi:hypothetical protein